jgi:hypothetical protein
MTSIAEKSGGQQVHELAVFFRPPDVLVANFRKSVIEYLAKALHIDDAGLSDHKIASMRVEDVNMSNVTPNGAVVPKSEYALEYNKVVRDWAHIVKSMDPMHDGLIEMFRFTPNIRIKFGSEIHKNVGRPLNTSIVHSDGWVEGPWGLNCFVPVAGDCEGNTLKWWETSDFEDRFLDSSDSYEKMQWVVEQYKPVSNLKVPRGVVSISDYALLHNSERTSGCGTRISLDTTLVVGLHRPQIRTEEYCNFIPEIGDTHYLRVSRSESSQYEENRSAFQHYTQGSVTLADLRISNAGDSK